MLKLFSNRDSGHSYKVAMLLALTGTSFQLIEVDISVPRPERSPAFRRDSRFQEVPVLIDGQQRVSQSNQILSYLGGKLGALAGSSAPERIRIGEWLFWESNRIGFSVANLRFYRRFRAAFPSDLEEFLRERALDDLSVLDAALSHKAYLAGDEITIADLSCSGYLFWLEEAGLDVENWPHVNAWLNRIADQPGWSRPEELLHPRIEITSCDSLSG